MFKKVDSWFIIPCYELIKITDKSFFISNSTGLPFKRVRSIIGAQFVEHRQAVIIEFRNQRYDAEYIRKPGNRAVLHWGSKLTKDILTYVPYCEELYKNSKNSSRDYPMVRIKSYLNLLQFEILPNNKDYEATLNDIYFHT